MKTRKTRLMRLDDFVPDLLSASYAALGRNWLGWLYNTYGIRQPIYYRPVQAAADDITKGSEMSR